MEAISDTEIKFFRSIRRTAAALLLIYRLNHPVLITEIASILNLDRKTAANQLKLLAKQGIITHTHTGWIMTQGGSQLILPINQDPQLMGKKSPSMGKNYPLKTISTTTSANPLLYIEEEEEEEEEDGEKIPILKALAEYGIGPTPNVLKLLNLPHVTPEYIRFHGERLKHEQKFSTGLLLTILKYGDPMPISNEERRYESFRLINERQDKIDRERKRHDPSRH